MEGSFIARCLFLDGLTRHVVHRAEALTDGGSKEGPGQGGVAPR